MAEYLFKDNEPITEPVTLLEQKAFSRIDEDYSTDDADLQLCISSARERLEKALNVGLANRDVSLSWYGYAVKMPLYPNQDIISVNDGTDDLTDDLYTVYGLGLKTIFVNSVQSFSNVFYQKNGFVEIESIADTNKVYTVSYNTGYEVLPNALKLAIMTEADYLYKLRGEPILNSVSPNAFALAKQYSVNLNL